MNKEAHDLCALRSRRTRIHTYRRSLVCSFFLNMKDEGESSATVGEKRGRGGSW